MTTLRKQWLVAFCMLMGTATAMQAQTTQPDWPNIGKYAQANQELQASGQKIVAVFMGNSITQKWVDSSPAFFSTHRYVGRGISGQTTPQFLLRFRADVLALHPQVVVINGGINDIAENTGPYRQAYTFGNIKSMVEIAQANGIRVIMTSVLPADGIPWRKEIDNVPNKVEALNKLLETYAREQGVVYVDYYASMVNQDKGMIKAYTTDGVHVTTQGYQVMQQLIHHAIVSILK